MSKTAKFTYLTGNIYSHEVEFMYLRKLRQNKGSTSTQLELPFHQLRCQICKLQVTPLLSVPSAKRKTTIGHTKTGDGTPQPHVRAPTIGGVSGSPVLCQHVEEGLVPSQR